ncbi:MAG TPA: hypothetical protein VH854_09065 [Thermoanaerobaculia bacterium]|jgi:hypothetical protein|nr:hypothetical protein [Thermoanaerobaculia bacterium]
MSGRQRERLAALAVVVLFVLPMLPEIMGARRLVFRDAQITHWPWRRIALASLESGRAPFVNASASGGQPLLANPNASLLYPTFLLERVAPPTVAFNLHYLFHVLWAFAGARALARRLGLARGPAFVAGVAFAFSGMALSYASAFMNSSAAAAWLPWCAAAALDLARAASPRDAVRAGTAAGLAFGLQLLAGEPAISLLTGAFAAALFLAAALRAPERRRALPRAVAAGVLGAAIAFALAAPLLLPLRQVFPLTYRGQHLYSERAFGASAFTADRALEWLLPRFGGDPGVMGGGANWLRSLAGGEIVYVWCVTLGVVPLLLIALGALRRDFWNRKTAGLAVGGVLALLFSFGLALPVYRALFSFELLRRLRYPIKFYLIATLCGALLAGAAAGVLARRRAGRRETALAGLLIAAFAAAFAAAAPGGVLERRVASLLEGAPGDSAAFLQAFRAAVRGDAWMGAAAVVVVLLLLRRGGLREPAYPLGLLSLALALVFGLPLFVTAADKDLDRPPALLHSLRGPGRLYVSPALPRFVPSALAEPAALPRFAKAARVIVEQLVPATAAPLGVRYLFDTDPDGSYGYFNRLTSEAAASATPEGRDRLLIAHGARWALASAGEEHPLFRTVTGVAVGGKRLVLFERDRAVPELRWAARTWRRASVSGILELLRDARFDPERDVALPGRGDEDPAGEAPGRMVSRRTYPDAAEAVVEADAPGVVVFARTYFPSWRARLDGAPAPILVANARDVGIAVPAGRHVVEIAWDASPFRRGVALQAAGLAVALAAAAWAGTRPQPA